MLSPWEEQPVRGAPLSAPPASLSQGAIPSRAGISGAGPPSRAFLSPTPDRTLFSRGSKAETTRGHAQVKVSLPGLGEATRCPKNRSDSHHPKMQFVDKQIVDESVDEVGCNSG